MSDRIQRTHYRFDQMAIARLLFVLFSLAFVARAFVFSQESISPEKSAPEFFGFEPMPLQRMKFIGPAEGIAIGDMHQHAQGNEYWWMSADGKSVFVAKGGGEVTLLKVNIESAEVTEIGTVPGKQYCGIRGNRTIIHLMRVDTADNRYRLITDVFSVEQRRIVATRTLIDLPRQPSKFPTRLFWDDRLQTVAVSVNDRPGVPAKSRILHVVSLFTGFEHLPKNTGSVASGPGLAEMIPLRFDASGHRLFLSQGGGAGSKVGSRLHEFGLDTRTLKRIGAATLPGKVPICINHDATLAVYTGADGYELWRVNEGKVIGTIARNGSEFSGRGRPLIQFVGNGNVLALSDGAHLRLFSGFAAIPSGQESAVFEHQIRPSDSVSPGADFVPVFLSSHRDTLMHFGAFTTYIPNRGPHGPWMHRVKIQFPGDEGELAVAPLKRTKPPLLPSDEWTPWAPGPMYQRQFKEITDRNKYPVAVFGRVRNGKMEFRGRFFDKPESLDFVSQHGATQRELKPPTMGHPVRGYREVWRHSFVDQNGTIRFNVIWRRTGEVPSRSGKRVGPRFGR